MFQVLILVCATAVAPDDCKLQTASSVIYGPSVTSVHTCVQHGQAYLAPTTLAPREGEYVKVRCRKISAREAANPSLCVCRKPVWTQ